MKFTKVSLSIISIASAMALSACSSVDLDKDKGAEIQDKAALEQMINNPDGPLAKKEVYFDFDSYTVSQENMPVVANHAKFLEANKNVHVRLEGNTDARGGREYNLALGQKRAEAVKARMTLLGVSPEQIETISFGKEKPKAYGTSEEDYAQNRRVDIKYQLQ